MFYSFTQKVFRPKGFGGRLHRRCQWQMKAVQTLIKGKPPRINERIPDLRKKYTIDWAFCQARLNRETPGRHALLQFTVKRRVKGIHCPVSELIRILFFREQFVNRIRPPFAQSSQRIDLVHIVSSACLNIRPDHCKVSGIFFRLELAGYFQF